MVPLILAGVLAAVLRSPTMLLFGLTGPVLSFATWIGERRRRSGAASDAERRTALEDAWAALDHALLRERRRLERSHPPLAEVLAVAETRSDPLWCGRGAEVRLGVGRRPSQVLLDGGSAPAPMWLQDVPVTVDLAEVGALGVCGERGGITSSAAAVVGRLATAVPPSRIEFLVVVAEPTRVGDWDFAGWLPQTRAVAMAEEAGPHLDRLLAEIARREDADRVRAPPGRSLVVVVVDGWPVARAAAATLDFVLRRGPSVGVVAVVLATSRAQLPRCGAVLALASGRAILSSADGAACALVPDQPGRSWVDRVSRALAPLRELSGVAVGARTDLPVSVGLLDLVGGVDAGSVVACWQRRSASTRAVLGVTSAGTLAVDLAVDGPHALIAGTTGAGKSELLQTLVCSLALANRPDELTFLLVDYKGGAAFRDCSRLPHVVGVVTDLDGQLTARALTSLTAELRRRERLFAAVGAGDMDEYRRARARDAALPAVPRLVIAIDEFRVLAEELPDFVHGLVRLAAVGRSLGVHLVLATQRPGGIVSADIRANVSLRIALRVRDRTDSVDVLDDPDAASIDATTPGRATLRGAATPLTRFQSARVTAAAAPVRRLTVTPLDRGWSDRPEGAAADHSPVAALTHPTDAIAPTDPTARTDAGGTEPDRRDLERIVDAVRGATTILGIPGPPSPWLPPLPDRLDVRSLESAMTLESVPLGLEDIPAEQSQTTWCWSIGDGHLGVAGGGRSGRTSTVLTIAAQLTQGLAPSQLHLYAIGPPSLSALAVLPHVAAVADADDADHIRLVLDRLAALSPSRRSDPGPGPGPDLLPDGDPARARPVLLIDGWERLAAHTHGSLAADVRALLETSSDSGLRVVVTGGRAVLAGQLAGLLGQRLVLALGDPVELALAGIPTRAVPGHQPPGRALDARTHREVQVGWLGPDPVAVLTALTADMPCHWTAGAPARVRRLPTSLTLPM
ncbi:MAG TPA: FtsK/SpoIIIE domain-containing protein, partial [Lapillicoccus sp.]|uniref:FtsK/SpoIIIE domain-containing protein n=1 Tax=Lapillicoccus sp. TaxID=1909287 RepID=UPI002F925846